MKERKRERESKKNKKRRMGEVGGGERHCTCKDLNIKIHDHCVYLFIKKKTQYSSKQKEITLN